MVVTMTDVITVSGLTKSFGPTIALDGLDLTVRAGEVHGLLGANGAGKSTLIKILTGVYSPSSGEILLEGRRIDNLPYEQMRAIRGRRIGAIFQDPLTSLNPLYTVGRQLTETILAHLPVNAAEARQRAIQLLKDTGIPAAEERIDHYPHQFSGGMRQRVVIALALLLYRPLLALSFSEVKARSLGMRPGLTHTLLLVMIGAAVIGSFQAVGTVLVFGLLVGPPATAALLTRSVPQMMLVSVVIGAACVVTGLTLSYRLGTAGSATMALMPILLFFVVLAVRAAVLALLGRHVRSRAQREQEAPVVALPGAEAPR